MVLGPFRYELNHPNETGLTLVYGGNGRNAYSLEVMRNGECVFICLLGDTEDASVVREVVRWTIEQGFFTPADVDDATAALDTHAATPLPPRLRALALLILRIRKQVERASSKRARRR